jgi:MraZ protein
MLIGEYQHNLDAKKRLSIPSKLRKELGGGAVITKGLDNCLFVFPMNEWNELAPRLAKLPLGQRDARAFSRLMLGSAMEVEFDTLGRILIPDYLKNYAGLERSVVIAGLYSRLEIWNEDRWNAHKADLEKNSDTIAQKLGDVGAI